MKTCPGRYVRKFESCGHKLVPVLHIAPSQRDGTINPHEWIWSKSVNNLEINSLSVNKESYHTFLGSEFIKAGATAALSIV